MVSLGNTTTRGCTGWISPSERITLLTIRPRSIGKFLPYLSAGLKHSLQDCGMRSLKELHECVSKGTVRFEIRTASAQLEGGVNMETYEKKLYA